MIKIKPPKTRPEKKLSAKYKKLLEMTDDFDELQNLAREFKADLSVFLQRNRRYAIMMMLFVNVSFGQEAIVASGDHNQTIGEVFPIMQQVQKVEESTLGVPKYEIPIEPKKKVKKISWIEKILLIIKNLFK